VVWRGIGPIFFGPSFSLVKKKIKKKIKKKKERRRACTRRTYKKKRDKLLCPFRVAVALPCVSGVVYSAATRFLSILFRDSVLPLCPHSVISTRF
jgi:hypothetical protein